MFEDIRCHLASSCLVEQHADKEQLPGVIIHLLLDQTVRGCRGCPQTFPRIPRGAHMRICWDALVARRSLSTRLLLRQGACTCSLHTQICSGQQKRMGYAVSTLNLSAIAGRTSKNNDACIYHRMAGGATWGVAYVSQRGLASSP